MKKQLNRRALGALLAALLTGALVPFTLVSLWRAFLPASQVSVQAVARYLNQSTPAEALIETYESELFFLLERPYHYPPDQVHVDLVQREMIAPGTPVEYDPLSAAPDYLVVGGYRQAWNFYDPVLQTGAFRLEKTFPGYQIYVRVQP